jgi:transmembrane sensor
MTDRIDENPPMMSIPEQAAEWLLRWQAGDVSIAERYEYLQWLKTSPVHIAEMLRICRLHSWLKDTKLNLYVTNEDTFSNVVELPPREREAVRAPRASGSGLWKVSIAAGAAAITLSAALAVVAKMIWLDHTLETHASEWRSMPLSDGSSISAAPYTRLHHDIGDEQRLISLEEGKAVFRVAKDPSRRPFLVEAGDVVIQATGTQFGVETRGGNVIVTMKEGSVMVSPAADSEAKFPPVSLESGEQLTVSASGSPRIASVDAERATDWTRVILSDGDTIGDAVAQFNEYNDIKIVVDEQTSARQMRGRFDAIDPLSFAETVKQSAEVSVVQESPELVRIGRPGRHR